MFNTEMNLDSGYFYIDNMKIVKIIMDKSTPQLVVKCVFRGVPFGEADKNTAPINEFFVNDHNLHVLPNEINENLYEGVSVVGVYKNTTPEQIHEVFEAVAQVNDWKEERARIKNELADMNEGDRGFKVRANKIHPLGNKIHKRFNF